MEVQLALTLFCLDINWRVLRLRFYWRHRGRSDLCFVCSRSQGLSDQVKRGGNTQDNSVTYNLQWHTLFSLQHWLGMCSKLIPDQQPFTLPHACLSFANEVYVGFLPAPQMLRGVQVCCTALEAWLSAVLSNLYTQWKSLVRKIINRTEPQCLVWDVHCPPDNVLPYLSL